jgi:LysR family transcriptional regulator, cell division regulator
MMPSASEISYFLEIASTLNLSRAAERLGISQPSLSSAVQRLETSVGTALFIRSKKGVTLTQAGKQLQIHARDLLQKWKSIKGQALASTYEVQGSYTIGCHPSVALYSLGGFLPDLMESHPQLEIKLKHDISRKITESVIRMETDIGIVVNPIRHPDLMIRKLCKDEFSFWVGEGRRKIQDFRSGEAVVICDPELLQTQDLMRNLKKSGISFHRILTSPNLEVIRTLVASGAGIGAIPGRVATSDFTQSLKRIPNAPFFHDEICILYRIENKSVRSIQVISEKIISFFAGK